MPALTRQFSASVGWRSHVVMNTSVGFTRFNAALGESQQLGDWRNAAEMARWLDALPHDANSGDVYAT